MLEKQYHVLTNNTILNSGAPQLMICYWLGGSPMKTSIEIIKLYSREQSHSVWSSQQRMHHFTVCLKSIWLNDVNTESNYSVCCKRINHGVEIIENYHITMLHGALCLFSSYCGCKDHLLYSWVSAALVNPRRQQFPAQIPRLTHYLLSTKCQTDTFSNGQVKTVVKQLKSQRQKS